VNLTADPARARLPVRKRGCLQPLPDPWLQLRWRIRTEVRLHPIAPAGCSPAMRDRSEEAATPGLPATLSRLGTSAVYPRATAAEPACAITGSVTIHACSDCTFSYADASRNKNSLCRCAKTVEDDSSLWKIAENLGKILPSCQARPSQCTSLENIREINLCHPAA